MLLIIQEELEATLTALHILLVTVKRLRGKTEPGGGVAVSTETRQRKTFQRQQPCAHISLVLSNGMRENCRNTDHIFVFETSVV